MTDLMIAESSLSPEEAILFHEKLWVLMEAVTREYTNGESTSVSSEAAQRLLASVCFVLNQYLIETEKTASELLSEDFSKAFEHGKKSVLRLCDKVRAQWKAACSTVPKIPSLALTETLKGINEGFYHYNIDLFAADIPCTVTYQLMESVPESLLGMEYLSEYLKRLLLENYVISRFDQKAVRRLLIRISPFYSEMLINLCEVPLQNAVGLSLLGKEVFSLEIAAADRDELVNLFLGTPDFSAYMLLEKAAERVCEAIGIPAGESREYVIRFVKSLLPRIKASAKNGLRGVFI